jgi:uncharacterized protein YjeT (DUF2065 family)
MKSVLPAVFVALGLVLLVVSLTWSVLFPPSAVWTKEKSVQLTELGNQATAIKLAMGESESRPRMHSGENAAELKEKYDKVAAEYKALYEEFRTASERPKSASTFLRWSGIAFVAAGALVVMATRRNG